jgi:uncharacterized protein YjiS (DUF1127 family)
MQSFRKWCSDNLQRILEAERRRQRARETVSRLEALDSRTLRDLGLHPTEIRSVAGETAGLADVTRVRSALSIEGPPDPLVPNHPRMKEIAP